MRLLRPSLVALSVVPAFGVAAACGSSSGGNASTADSGLGAEDSSLQDSGSQSDGPAMDGDAGDASVLDGSDGSDGGDGGILGANCPAVDAGNFAEAPHGPLPTMAYYGGPVMT